MKNRKYVFLNAKIESEHLNEPVMVKQVFYKEEYEAYKKSNILDKMLIGAAVDLIKSDLKVSKITEISSENFDNFVDEMKGNENE